jgi:hypothetical protein
VKPANKLLTDLNVVKQLKMQLSPAMRSEKPVGSPSQLRGIRVIWVKLELL